MSKQLPSQTCYTGDTELRFVLKNFDPVEPLTSASQAGLEKTILMQLDHTEQQPALSCNQAHIWMLRQGWSMRAAIFPVVMIVMTGFLAGQFWADRTSGTLFANGPTVLASADETSTPPLSAALWGDTDDDDQ